ncbi:non-homologous end-joining DNA ligase [Streptomyces zhihengii]|uniref:Non-homologous end-joining DNA ligase n=1 Tax=Streptomyces zhihengii TaxID=1818004 RepID=A0ABS2UJK4_9ACTN|nr:non-homologous end-joining DNA ligase [Streptomyces zhihengii]MBM9617722.1 non-homologous end-joining DNA ligase [Streptomyces zhihengii]
MSTEKRIRAGRRTVAVSRPDKILFPDDGITKAGLAEYYRRVAGAMVPHLAGRPLMLERRPDGVTGQVFMQKEVPAYFPEWFHRVELPKEGGTVVYPVCDDAPSLVYLAGQACITPHRFLSRADRPDHPDRMVFDLDPADEGFGPVRVTALRLRELLDGIGLPSAVMTTGSRGLHVVVPLDRRAPFDEVRRLARAASEVLVARHPDELTTAARKEARGDRLYLDVQRNAYAQTAVAPYAVRALDGAPVAAPLRWAEVADGGIDARSFTMSGVLDRLDDGPWRGAFRRPRSARAALGRLERREPSARDDGGR